MLIHEGMGMGKPAAIAEELGVRELHTDGETALIVARNDAEAMRAGLARLLDAPALAARLGAAAHARFVARHLPERMCRAHEALFETLLRDKPAIRPV